jgi:hypothetical protein
MSRPVVVTLFYAAIAVVMTWPLVPNLGSAIAGDLGDPVFNAWVLLWTSGQVLAALGGDFGALGQYWQGNIFYPEQNTLAFSEHLTPQMLQILPVMALTDNVLVAYNLLFLSTFVLCGLGVYLLVRDLTDRPLAAFVAGLAFAWAPYRLAQVPHLQVLTSYWMPLTLVGFHRYFATRRLRPLAGGSAAFVAQNLSCGYYLLYFPPFVAAWCLYEMTRRRLLRDWRVWTALGVSAVTVALFTWPFVEPYLAVRAAGDIGVRPAAEIRSFSADVWAFGTAAPSLRLWADRMYAFPKPEGEGFPGLAIAALAAVAIAWSIWRTVVSLVRRPMPAWLRFTAMVSSVVCAVSGTIAAWVLAASGLRLTMGGTLYIYFNPMPAAAVALSAAAVLAGTLVLTRQDGAHRMTWPTAFFIWALLAAALLAFGPVITSEGRPLAPGPFALLQDWVPGFDGLRVPARFFMLVALFASVLAGFGAALLERALPRRGAVTVLGLLALVIVTESWIAPMRMNVPLGVPPELVAPTSLRTGRLMSPLYGVIERMPGQVVLIEFPFGEPAHDLQAMFYAGYHRRPISNGYSGFFPQSFQRRAGRLWDPTEDPVRAAGWLVDTAATHALVHEAHFADDRGAAVSAWLVSMGARLMTSDGPDKLFQLK